ncbi:hypothetical protein FRC04_005779 [Tulasnella sp. 424]|nr:hypothetical protein FRC04_005779 [Tulasnella sp. 424]KAG8961906.1 hypothetical protein FRC05_005658 [Tulasnella sp. 425]
MRFSTVIVALVASVVSASALSERQSGSFPPCSIPCLTNATTGSCSPTDNTCLCKSDDYLRSTTTCIQGACSAADLATAAGLAQQLCKAAGVDISNNPAAQPTSASGAAATGAAATSAKSSSTAAAASATPTHNAAVAGSVVGKGMMVGGFVAAAAVLAL